MNNVHVPFWFKRVRRLSTETDYKNFVPPIPGAKKGETTNEKCPADGMALDRYKLSGLKFEGCPKCHGMWLEKDELRQLKNKVNDGQLHWLNREVDNIEKASSISSSRFCPKCVTNKLRSILFGHSGVIIDWCPVCHGVWLDRDEFDSIVSYLREEATAATPREIAHEIGEDLKRTVTGEGPESRLADFGDAAFALEACANAFVFEHPAFFRFLTGEARSGRSIGMD